MDLTYVLVDFENVQPRDLGLLGDPGYRVKLFHGPHQTKLDVEVVKALQPLGDRVEYVQSDRHGKNVLDFHMAFDIGRLVEKHRASGQAARFVIVSKDRDFDPLLAHVRSLGFHAQQVVAVGDAVGAGAQAATRASPPVGVGPCPAAPGDKRVVPAPAGTTKNSASAKQPEAAAIETVVQRLRAHATNRPTTRKTLERHIPALLGGKASSATVRRVIAELVRLGHVAFENEKVRYSLGNKP